MQPIFRNKDKDAFKNWVRQAQELSLDDVLKLEAGRLAPIWDIYADSLQKADDQAPDSAKLAKLFQDFGLLNGNAFLSSLAIIPKSFTNYAHDGERTKLNKKEVGRQPHARLLLPGSGPFLNNDYHLGFLVLKDPKAKFGKRVVQPVMVMSDEILDAISDEFCQRLGEDFIELFSLTNHDMLHHFTTQHFSRIKRGYSDDVDHTRPDPKSPFHTLFNRVPFTKPAKTPAMEQLREEITDMDFDPNDVTMYEAWANLSYTCQVWRPFLKSSLNDKVTGYIDRFFATLKEMEMVAQESGDDVENDMSKVTDSLANMMMFALARVSPLQDTLLNRCYEYMDNIGVSDLALEKRFVKDALLFPQHDVSKEVHRHICDMIGHTYSWDRRGSFSYDKEMEKHISEFIERASPEERNTLYEIIIQDRLNIERPSWENIQWEHRFMGSMRLAELDRRIVRDQMFLGEFLDAVKGEGEAVSIFGHLPNRRQIFQAVNLAYKVTGLSELNHSDNEPARDLEAYLPHIDTRLINAADKTLQDAARRADHQGRIDQPGFEFLQDYQP